MTTMLAVSAAQWGQLPDLNDVAPLDETDIECMHAVREVLLRFGKVDRFALHLVHKQFDMEPDEILVEEVNPETRERSFRPQKWGSEEMKDAIPTGWILKDMEPSVRCVAANPGSSTIM